MADAYVIEIAGETVGVAVREGAAFRFFASRPAFFPLENRPFESPEHAQLAALGLRGVDARLTRLAKVASPHLERTQP
ncbi:MAG TPA: hypothetical protein VEF36_04490 [Roseiarcus sp.]|nr:hypothetical protein [Roseiarcus sp.]